MDHSLEGYLERQSTEALRLELFRHRQALQTEHTRFITDVIERILKKRGAASSPSPSKS